jgi:archaellin
VQSVEKERENLQERAERPEKTERFTVLEGLRKYAANHVLLVGRPGSGKSTALAQLLWETSVGAQSLRPETLGKNHQIPILIELRFYETSIFDLILQFLQRHGLNIDSNTLESWLFKNQNFTPLLLLDGINEFPSEAALRDLQQFRQQYAKIPMIFTLTRTGDLTNAFTVNYTIGGTATKKTDYNNLKDTVTFAAGSSKVNININPIDDTTVEGSESVILTLANNANYTIGTGNSATVTIADNDNLNPPGNGGKLDWIRQFGTNKQDFGTTIATAADGTRLWIRQISTPTVNLNIRGNIRYEYFNETIENISIDHQGNLVVV